MYKADNRVHDQQTVHETYRSGLYCVDERARLRWRVAHHCYLPPNSVLLAQDAGSTVLYIGRGLARTAYVVQWP